MSWPGGQFPGTSGNAQPPDLNALYQQFQLQPGPRPPASGVPTVPPAPFSTPGLFSTATQPQAPPQPSSASATMEGMQMLLAKAMSIPIATALFQSMMGGTQQPQPAAPPPPMFPSAPMMQPHAQSPMMMIQMMQQAMAAAAASSAAAAPQISVPPPPPPAAQHLPTPASSPSTSSAIQLPPMEPSVAKEMLAQLVQQLQQAGQLPYDESLQRLLNPNTDIPRVHVKKEDEEQAGSNPMCIISKTETCDEKPQPEVYMDVAEDTHSVSTESTQNDGGFESDGGDEDGYSMRERIERSRRSPRITKSKSTQSRRQTQTRPQNAAQAQRSESQTRQSESQTQQNVSQTQQKSSSQTRRSHAVETDSKLQGTCIVKLAKVQVVNRPLAQQSRIDKLKNMKKYCFSADVLQTQKTPETKPSPASAPAAAAPSSREPIDRKSTVQEKAPMPVLPLHQQLGGPSSRTGPKNIFSIFAQHVVGRGVIQEEPAPEVRPSDPLPPSVGVLLQRSINVAQNNSLSLRSMYLGYASHNMEWLSLVSGVFGANKKTFCQCTFCPALGEFPRDVAVHISRDHQDLLFALNKLKPVVGPLMYIKCRHCNFVTVESTVAWIHFDIHHGISDILDCSDRAIDMDMSGPDMPGKFIDIDDVMGSTTAYVCYDCSAVNADVDLRESSMLMARHVVRHHPNSINCNGNFVKLQMLTRTVGDPDSIKGSPTYRQAICDSQHARGRREVYICMFCR